MASNSGPSPSLDLGGLSSNIISDFGPILSLFGEQVAMQFMSQSMGWLDHIVFAMAPLGIITAIVGAIRVGGSGWLKAIIGRARESYATAEVELMSSTSHEVCEMWDGQNIVRIMGAPAVREVIYIKERVPGGGAPTGEHTCDLYSLEKDAPPGFLTQIRGGNDQKSNATSKGSTESTRDAESGTATETETTDKSQPRSAPNISLNIHNYVSKWELYLAAASGILLQTAILVYAYYCTYNPVFKLKLGVSSPVIWAWYFTLTGTLCLITGMLGCCYIIEKSTAEKIYRVKKDKQMQILWLQKGEIVNDQVFNSHAIFTKDGRTEIMTSRRNDKVTDPKKTKTPIFEYTTTAAAFLSLIGFILQFMGLRGMHWSVSVAQVLATIIMTILRTVVRRGLSECPHYHELPQKHEMDWLATRLADDDDQLTFWKGPEPADSQDTAAPGGFWDEGCWRWKIVTGAGNSGYDPPQSRDLDNRAQKVVEARKRLGYLTQWPGAYSDKATSITAAIELMMNIPNLFASDKEEFLWSMNVDLKDLPNAPEATPSIMSIEFKIKKEPSGKWKVDLAEIEAVLSLWMFSVSKEEESSSRLDKKDRKDEFLRSGKASRQQSIRLLGPSTPSSRRDMKWWINGGLSKVLEVDLAKPTEKDSPRSVTDSSGSQITIKPGDHHVVGFAGGEIESGVYKTKPLSEVSIVSTSDGKENAVFPVSGGSRFCLAAVSDAPLDLLFAQEMFSAFMWAFAKSPYTNQIEGRTKLQPQSDQSSNSSPDWQSFALQNTTLLKLAQNIENIGLGNLDEVYMSILPPLIAHHKLPDTEVLVDNIHQKTKELQLSGNWEKAGDLYLWAFEAYSHGILDSGSTTTPPIRESGPIASTSGAEPTTSKALIKATAVLLQFLQALSTETERYQIRRAPHSQQGISNPMKKFRDGLARLRRNLGDIKVFGELAWLYKKQCRDTDWYPLLDVKDGLNTNSDITNITNPEAFGLTKAHQAFLSNLEPSLKRKEKWKEVLTDMDDVHGVDALGWTLLHYAANNADNKLIQQLLEFSVDWKLKDLWGWTPLHYAAASKKARVGIQREYLKERIDLNSQGRDGFSPLHCSAVSGNVQMARFLVESGANLQTFDNSRKTPLHWAAYHGFTDILDLMLGYGASSLACDESGKTPLHLAAIKGSSNVVAAVAKAMGGMIDIRESGGWTAMEMAAFYGYNEFIEKLLDSGANTNSRGGEYGNALQVAARSGHVKTVEVLLDRGANVNAQGGKYGNALQAAVTNGHSKVVKVLLDHGAELDEEPDEYGSTVQAAIKGGHVDAVKMFLGHVDVQGGGYRNESQAVNGHDEAVETLLKVLLDPTGINAQGGRYGNALQAAAWMGNFGVVKMLLDFGANVNAQGGRYGNALQAAARMGSFRIVKKLLDSGANVNVQGGEYGNALQATAANGDIEVAKVLLDHGANVNTQGGRYGHALQAAAWGGKVRMTKMMLDRGANVNAQGGEYGNALQAAAWRGDAESVKALLGHKANVNTQGGKYGNALQAAAWRGNIESVKLLLDCGAEVNAQGGIYGSALQATAADGSIEVLKLLLDRGPDVNAQGGVHGNPLQAAAWRGKAEVVKLLLDRGADVNAQGGIDGSALQAASTDGHLDIVKMLLDHKAKVNAQGGRFGSALQAARKFEYLEIVKLLQAHEEN